MKISYVRKRQHVVYNQAQDILNRHGFLEAVENLRLSLPNEQTDFDRGRIASKLLKDFNLERKWFEGVKSFLLSGDMVDLKAPLSPIIRTIFDGENQIKELSLILSKDSTLEDVEELWGEVKLQQAKMPGKVKKKNVMPRNRNRDRIIKELRNEGQSYTKIGEKTGHSYPEIGTILRNERRRNG
jgi:hypothetical protein